jgi:hypothetical protein
MNATRLSGVGCDIFERDFEISQSNYRFNSTLAYCSSNGNGEFCVQSDGNDSLQELLISINAALDWNLKQSAQVRESIEPMREDFISSIRYSLLSFDPKENVVSTSMTTNERKEPAKYTASCSFESKPDHIVADTELGKSVNLCRDSFYTAIEATLGPLLPEDVMTSLIPQIGSNLSELSDNSSLESLRNDLIADWSQIKIK